MTGAVASTQHAAREWREPMARAGLAAKGVLYIILGLLALQFALGKTSGDDVSQAGAFERVAEEPWGKFLLVALVVGLVCLTLWHVIEAFTGDPIEGSETSDKLKYAAKAVVYGAISFIAIKVTVDAWNGGGTTGQASDNQQSQDAAKTLFDLPGGTALVVLAGLVFIGIAIYQFVHYVLDTEQMQRIEAGHASGALRTIGRIGYAARAIVLAIIGVFFLVAAVQHDPAQSKGMSGAVQSLADESWGRILLWVIAVGFVLFGVFCLAESRLRRAA
jgi:hypothetical protein